MTYDTTLELDHGQAFASMDSQRIREALADPAMPVTEAVVRMKRLQDQNPATFNRVLCETYDVACYRNGDSCFANTVSACERDLFFISVPVEREFEAADAALIEAYHPTLPAAEAAAVEGYRLDALFFSEADAIIEGGGS